MSANKETLDSAVLTTLIKSVKLLTQIKESQDDLALEITEIKNTQDIQKEALHKLDKLATHKDVQTLSDKTQSIEESVGAIDVNKVVKEMQQSYLTLKKDIDTTMDSLQTDISNELNESNKATSVKTLSQLVDGLSNLHSNMVEIAKRVEALSGTVTESSNETKSLTDTIIESNSRVKSMDLRMGAFIEGVSNDDEGNENNLDGTLSLLQSLSGSLDESIDGKSS